MGNPSVATSTESKPSWLGKLVKRGTIVEGLLVLEECVGNLEAPA